jgi:phosphoglycolate phosphatase-like HAD superfamily hydrolase
MASFELVLFDIDGTLVDTGGAGARSWEWAFERFFTYPGVDIGRYSKSGMTDPVIARHVFEEVMRRAPEDGELTLLMAGYMAVVPDFVAASEGYTVLKGVPEVLERLTGEGVLLGITSGGLEPVAHAKLGRGQLNRFFLLGGYGSDSEDRIELTRLAIERGERRLGRSIDLRRVAVVGDTPLDVEAAEGVGAVSVAVASGRYTVEQLRAAGADHVLSSLREPFPEVPG